MQAPGHIRRLTAAIVVNDRQAALAQKGKSAIWQPRSADELQTLTTLAQAAVGFDTTRGDLVTVQDLAFDENRGAPSVAPLGQLQAMMEHSPVLVKYATLLTGLILFILLAIRPALRRAQLAPKGTSTAKGVKALPGAAVQAALPRSDPTTQDLERQRLAQVFDQVTGHLKQDPAQSSRLLQSWIHSD